MHFALMGDGSRWGSNNKSLNLLTFEFLSIWLAFFILLPNLDDRVIMHALLVDNVVNTEGVVTKQ